MRAYIPLNLKLSIERCSDKYYYILTQIYYGRIFDKRIEPDSFVPLSSKILHNILGGDYRKYILFLIHNGIIESDNHYRLGEKSKGYRFTEEYRHRKFQQVEITDKNILENVRIFRAEQESKIQLDQHQYIYDCLQQVKIDAEGARNYIEQNIYSDTEYSNYNISVDLIDSKSFFFTVDSTAGRVHNNITNLSRDLRPFLSFNNEKLVEIDIANSQPFLFNILINAYDVYSKPSFLGMYDTDRYMNLPYVTSKKTDILIYRESTSSGKFYEYLMDKLNIEEERSEFKVRFFKKIFFSKENPYYISEERKQFTELFPNVSQIISHYKKDDYKNLAITLQKAEAEIMINTIVPRLAEKGIYCLTIHDSILTTLENSETVKKIILDEFKKQYGLIPTIKIK